jgi:putative ATP-binding cassette transporter
MSDDVSLRDVASQRRLINRLKSGTILGIPTSIRRIPEIVINFMRTLSAGTDPREDEDPNAPKNPYKWAHRRVSRLWSTSTDATEADDKTSVSKFNSTRKLLTAYWTSEKWKSAWGQTGLIVGLSALMAQDTVWITQSAAQFMADLASFKPHDPTSLKNVFTSLASVGGAGALMIAVNDRLMRYKMGMRQNMTNWMTTEFMSAILHEKDGVQKFTHNKTPDDKSPDAMPANPHQSLGNIINQMNNLITYIGGETVATLMTTVFITKALYDHSVPIEFLDNFATHLNSFFPDGAIDLRLGDKGMFALALASGIGYLALTVPKAYKICRATEENYMKTLDKSGAMTGFLVNMFDRGDAIAASNGHIPLQQTFDESFAEVQESVKNDDRSFRRYNRFNGIQDLIGSKLVSLVPGFSGLYSGTLNFQGLMETQGLVLGSFFAINHYIMQAFPSIARIKTFSGQLTEMAQMIDRMKDKEDFYNLSGIHEFKREAMEADVDATTEPKAELKLTNLELMHRGKNAQPFLQIPELTLEKGSWVYVEGESGSGKSCFFKAVADLWPYGRGKISTPEDSKIFYAKQEPDISPHFTLAEQVIYGLESVTTNFKDYVNSFFSGSEKVLDRIEWALNTAGLSGFSDQLTSKTCNGRSWPEVLSGGQKQKLVLARILFQQPDILLLDEATSALDSKSKQNFFAALKEHCHHTTVLAIIHDETSPKDVDNQPFFKQKLKLHNGTATLHQATENIIPLQPIALGAPALY